MSCLAGILVIVAYNMSEWRSFKSLFRNSKSDIAVLLTTFFLTVIIDLTVAIQFGLLLAVLLFLKRVIDTSGVEVLNMAVDSDGAEADENTPQLILPKKVEVFEVNGPFFFGIANKFEEAEKQVTRRPKIRIIRLYRVPFIDATGLSNLKSFIRKSQANGITIILSGPVKSVYDALEKNGFIDLVGNKNVCADINIAIARSEELLKENA
jgi:SulP family sulfate permease